MQITPEVVNQFKRWMSVSGLSKDTILDYCATLEAHCIGREIESVNRREFFVEFKEELEGKGRMLATYNRHMYAIKKFLVFLGDNYGIPIINILQIKTKRPPAPNPSYLELEEIEQVRKTSCDPKTKFLFEFLLHTGCRISEALNINFEEVDFTKGEVSVIGKGMKRRTVFLGESLNLIERHNTGPLFKSSINTRMLRSKAHERMKRLGREAGLGEKLHPHLLRATFATHMIRSGVDPRTLQEMLGHDDIETTLRHYTGVSYARMKEVHKSFEKALSL